MGFKNKQHTKETKERMSFAKLGSKNPNYNKATWNKGKKGLQKHSEEVKRKMCLTRKKEDNPHWKGGRTSKQMILRTSKRFVNWRRAVFKRDNYICQNPNCKFCNNKIGGSLEAHHIVPFAECLNLDYEELIFDTDNGITLCKDYHRKSIAQT